MGYYNLSNSFIDFITNQMEYHREQEEIKAKGKNYTEALYHSVRLGAFKDLVHTIDRNKKEHES